MGRRTCPKKNNTKTYALTNFCSFIKETFNVRCCRWVTSTEAKKKFTCLCCEQLNRTFVFRIKIATNFILNLYFLNSLETDFWIQDRDLLSTRSKPSATDTETAKMWSRDIRSDSMKLLFKVYQNSRFANAVSTPTL